MAKRFLRAAFLAGSLAGSLAADAAPPDAAPVGGAASGGARVAIPHLFDPRRRPEAPDLSGLRVIRVLTEDDYPPLHFATEDGGLAGFNVDLARALCDELKVACTV